ncbi:MAG: PH domain-containing protein [Ruminococcus sp.]|nr:PH domain-containing protein [Ruminococcus sp.]
MTEQKAAAKHGRLREFLRRRQHPIKIIGYTSKTLWLLLIPLSKNFVASNFDIQGWLRTYWLDFITVLVIVGLAVFRWLFVFYRIDRDRITTHSGPFGLMTTTVYFSEITAMRTEQSYVYRAVNACTMFIETAAVSLTRTEMRLVISEKSVDEIYKRVSEASEGEASFYVSPKRSHMLLFSVMFSSTASGLLVFGAIVLQAYRMIGGEMERQVADKVNGGLTQLDSRLLGLSKTVPQAVLFVGLLIAGGWLISFFSNFMGSWDFTACRRGKQMLVQSGAIRRTRKVLERSAISYFDIRQSLLMKLVKLSSVHILCPGYSSRKKDAAALIPISNYRELNASLRMLAPELGRHHSQVSCGRKAIKGFLIPPIIMSTIPVAAGTVAKHFISRWHEEITVFMIALTVPILWKIIVAAMTAGATSAGMTDETVILSYVKRFRFHKVIVPAENVTMIQLSQSPLQRRAGLCTLKVYTASELVRPHKVRRLPYKECAEMLAMNDTELAGVLLAEK